MTICTYSDIELHINIAILVIQQDEVFQAPSVLPSKVRELRERERDLSQNDED